MNVTITFAFVVLAMLTSCQNIGNMRLRTMVGGGFTDLDIDAGALGEASIDGKQASLRVEIVEQPDYVENIEVGLRLLGGFHSLDERENGLSLDLDTYEVGGVAVIRPFFDVNETFRLYVEGFAGYRHYWGDSMLSDSMGNSISDSGNDGGVLFGAGLGSEFKLQQGDELLVRSRVVQEPH